MILHSFTSADGAIPFAGPLGDGSGNLYVATEKGGTTDNGVVLKLNPSGSATLLHSFSGADGDSATGMLIEGADGNLYGTTYAGGSGGMGVVFRVSKVSPVQLLAVVSRKTHGSAGIFDVDLTNGNGIECRSQNGNGDYTIVFSFAQTLTSVGGASVSSGIGSVTAGKIDAVDSHNYIVNLAGVANAQVVTLGLSNVTDSGGGFSSSVSASMGVLIGDVNASSRVDAADVSLVRQQTLQPITQSNFREDINASGRVDAADVSIARQQTLTSLP
jgi:uncharacterized repeat protein (TIGR03803 family)